MGVGDAAKTSCYELRSLGMGSVSGGEWQSKEIVLPSLSLSRSIICHVSVPKKG